MNKTQEPKYDAVAFADSGRAGGVSQVALGYRTALVNRVSGKAIPHDEPVFILRARDVHAVRAIEHYRGLCHDEDHKAFVAARVLQFQDFAEKHPERMKEPDSP